MAKSNRTCFGFFVGDESCQRCSAAKKCKAILVSDGFDVAAGVLDELLASLPEGVTFRVNVDELLMDASAGADEDKKKRARGEAKKIYDQLVHGEALSDVDAALSQTTLQSDQIDPKDL